MWLEWARDDVIWLGLTDPCACWFKLTEWARSEARRLIRKLLQKASLEVRVWNVDVYWYLFFMVAYSHAQNYTAVGLPLFPLVLVPPAHHCQTLAPSPLCLPPLPYLPLTCPSRLISQHALPFSQSLAKSPPNSTPSSNLWQSFPWFCHFLGSYTPWTVYVSFACIWTFEWNQIVCYCIVCVIFPSIFYFGWLPCTRVNWSILLLMCTWVICATRAE
jgi:hypothetical protein